MTSFHSYVSLPEGTDQIWAGSANSQNNQLLAMAFSVFLFGCSRFAIADAPPKSSTAPSIRVCASIPVLHSCCCVVDDSCRLEWGFLFLWPYTKLQRAWIRPSMIRIQNQFWGTFVMMKSPAGINFRSQWRYVNVILMSLKYTVYEVPFFCNCFWMSSHEFLGFGCWALRWPVQVVVGTGGARRATSMALLKDSPSSFFWFLWRVYDGDQGCTIYDIYRL